MGKPIGKFDFLHVAYLWIIKLIDWNVAQSKAGKERRGLVWPWISRQAVTALQTTGRFGLDLLFS